MTTDLYVLIAGQLIVLDTDEGRITPPVDVCPDCGSALTIDDDFDGWYLICEEACTSTQHRIIHGTPPALRLVCAWCQKILRDGVEPVSHGMCEPCAAEQQAEIEAIQ